jgi:predicted transcriptional regulator YdeE
MYEKSKGALAEVSETWEDIIAEARAELAEEHQKPAFEAANGGDVTPNNSEPKA